MARPLLCFTRIFTNRQWCIEAREISIVRTRTIIKCIELELIGAIVIIQPVGDVGGREVIERQCSEEFAEMFKSKYGNGNDRRGVGFGPKTAQVILNLNDGFIFVPSTSSTMQAPVTKIELLIDINIKDHWEYYQRRSHHNLAERQNNLLQVTLDQAGKKINVLTPAWLLRQKIYQWVDRADDIMVDTTVKTKQDWKNIDTLTSILVKMKEKCYMTSAEDKDVLKKFVMQSRVDLGEEFTSVVWSPEVMGDWGNVLWVQILMMQVGFIVLGLLKEHFWDE